jgi:hypothetical protein
MTDAAVLAFCATCPNPCRRAWPAGASPQLETVTPSALALLALMVVRGEVRSDAATLALLERTEMARHCRVACPYDYDIAGLVERVHAGRRVGGSDGQR